MRVGLWVPVLLLATVVSGTLPSLSQSAMAGSLASTTVNASATGGGWPMFHHDNRHLGIVRDTSVTATSASYLTVRWSTFIGPGTTGWPDITASPVVAYNANLGKFVAYIATTGTPATVDAVDMSSGLVLWTFQPAATVEGGMAVFHNTLYVGSDDGNMYAINAASGQLRCSFNTGGRVIAAPVVFDPDGSGALVYFGDAGPSEATNIGHEWAITAVGNPAGACQQRWVFNAWANTGTTGSKTGSWSPPAIGVDPSGRPLVVFGSSNPDDSVYALDARTGAEAWRYQTYDGSQDDVGAGPTISAPGINGFADGVVYIDGKTKIEYAIDLVTGALIWQFNLLDDSGIATNSVSTAALVGKRLVVGYSDYAYALNAVTGARIWRSPQATGTFLTSPAISGGGDDPVVLAGDTAGVEHAYRLSDGSEVLSLAACGKILSSTAVVQGMVFFGCDNGDLVALG